MQQTSTAAFIHWLSKTFQCAHCNADANQRIKGIQQLDKEGLMPTSVPLATIIGIKHIVCLFFPLSWHSTNKMAVLVATGTQHKRCTESNTIKWFYGLKCISYQKIDALWCWQEKKKKGGNSINRNDVHTIFKFGFYKRSVWDTHTRPWYPQQAEPLGNVLWLRIILMLNIDHSVYFTISSSISVKGAALQPVSILFSFFSFI